MNYQETEILTEMKFLDRNEQKDVLHFIEEIKQSHQHKIHRRRAMMQIRQALSSES